MPADSNPPIELASSNSTPVEDLQRQHFFEHEFRTPVTCYGLSQPRKWLILLCLMLLLFFDGFAAYTPPIPPIQMALKIPIPHQTWILSSYLITFVSCNILFGRVSDLYSPTWVLLIGVFSYAVFNVIISFMSNMYAFFIFRALCGISGAAITPSSYRIITNTFRASERPQAFFLYATAGALSNTFGGTLSGAAILVPGTGMMAGWRWFFRVAAFGVLVPAIGSAILIPKKKGDYSHVTDKIPSLDLFGSLILLGSTGLTVAGLTLGAAHGFSSAFFLAPFIIGILLFPTFLYWEYKRPPFHSLIPHNMWKIPNFWILLAYSVPLSSWWTASNIPFMLVYTRRYGEAPWHAAVRLLASGIASLVTAPILQHFPVLLRLPALRWTITAGAMPAIMGYVLFAQPDNYATDYWRLVVPGLVLGSMGNTAAYTGSQVSILSAAPPSLSGIAGGMFQVASALGNTLALSVQAAFLSSRPGDVLNNYNLHHAFYFQVGWQALWIVGFLILGRPKETIRWDDDD